MMRASLTVLALLVGVGCLAAPIPIPTAPTVVAPPAPPPITQVAVVAHGIPFSADADVIVTPYLQSGAHAPAHVVCRSTVGYFEPASFDVPRFNTKLRNATVPTAIECEADGVLGRTTLNRHAWSVNLMYFTNGLFETAGQSTLSFLLSQNMRDVPATRATIVWGDGAVESVTGSLVSGSVSAVHRYPTFGTYPVRVEVAWAQGSNSASALYAVR